MGNQQFPGVYVEEIPRMPGVTPAVTCLPLFIGYTAKATDLSRRGLSSGERMPIASLAEFERCFGQGPRETLRLMLDVHGQIVTREGYSPFYLHACVQQYFANGGSLCEILSLGAFPDTPDEAAFSNAIGQLPVSPSFTMVAMPDAVSLPALPQLQQQLLAYCQQQTNCLAILDIPYCNHTTLTTTVDDFRKQIGDRYLRYGAAFLPWLEVINPGMQSMAHLEIKYTPGVANAWSQYHKATKLQSSLLRKRLQESPGNIHRMIPPSGTIMGLFQANARNIGIWKTPTSAEIQGIRSLSVSINDQQQETLNVDPQTGKSINAIRRFSGRGIRLWGGRTLAGNDSESRYISVTLTTGFIKASLEQYLSAHHFASNDTNVWAAIRQSVETFLQTLWRNGALQGNKPEQAFFVRLGLDQTMTAADVAAGLILIDVGFALVRPAEFTILKLQHQLATNQPLPVQTADNVVFQVRKKKVRAQTSPINVAINPILPTTASKPRSLESS